MVAALITGRLSLRGILSCRVETASSTGSAVFESAFYPMASGYCRDVLIIAGEKMTHVTTAQTTKMLAELIDLPYKLRHWLTLCLTGLVTVTFHTTIISYISQ